MPVSDEARRVWAAQAPYRAARREQFALLPPPIDADLFLGDSLTEGGAWSEWLPGARAVNRGIGSDTTDEVLARLDDAIRAPRRVFLMIGTNDLALGRAVRGIADRTEQIVRGIHTLAPDAAVVVQSVLPRDDGFREEVAELNAHLAEIAAPRTSFLDLRPALTLPDGRLDPASTFDGLHLTGEGYRRWVAALRPLIDTRSRGPRWVTRLGVRPPRG